MSVNWREYGRVSVDWRAAALVALFAIVIAGAVALRPWLLSTGVESGVSGTSTTSQAAGGVGWALLEAAFAGVLLVAIVAFRHLGDWLQETLKKAAVLVIWMVVGATAAHTPSFWLWAGGGAGLYIAARSVDHFDLWWVVNDSLAIGVAVWFGAVAGIALGPIVVGVGLIGLSIYDHVFADREGWMFELAGWTLNNRLPAVFLVPNRLRLDWDTLADAMTGDVDDEQADELLGFGIGMADLALPAGFVVALVHYDVAGAVVGAVVLGIAISCARVSWKMSEGGGAGLPPLTTGALGAWAVATVALLAVGGVV